MAQPSLQQLEAFIASYEEGSFSAASRRLGKAQSAVSTLIQNLELDIDVQLFDRTKKQPTLTEHGLVLLKYAEQTLSAAHRFSQAAISCAKGIETQLSIAIEDFIEPENFQYKLKEFQLHFPNTNIELLNPSGDEIIDMLYEDRVQIGFILSRNDYPSWLSFCFMGNQPLPVLVNPEHPLAMMDDVTIQDVRKYRQLVITTRSKEQRLQIADSAWYCEHISYALDLASQGLGWVNAPKRLYQHYVDAGKLKTLDLHVEEVNWNLGWDIVWNAKSDVGQAAKWFLNNYGIKTES